MNGQDTPLIGRKTKTPTHTLVRVRNNQRQHRQRRREYMKSLEQRLEATEETARQLRIENEALRKQVSSQNPLKQETSLFTTMAISNTDITTKLTFMDTGECRETWYMPSYTGVAASDSAVGSIATGLEPGTTLPQVQTEPNDSTVIKDKSTNLLFRTVSATLFPDVMLPSTYFSQPSAMQSPSMCCSETSSELDPFDNGAGWPGNQPPHPLARSGMSILSTTLCSQAYLLIWHQNSRGLPLKVIDSWLWPGFIYSEDTDESGCRVDSRLLLGLLVYVAEDSDVEMRVLGE